jgi:hypothetical protein
MKNVFQLSDKTEILERIHKLTPNTQRKWGKMTVAQMLAHLNVSYEMIYEDKHPKPNFLMGLILKYLVKNMVVNEKPYKQNGQTAPAFIIKDDKDFETEKNRLIDYVNKTQELGEAYFNGKESHSFGALNKTEWNNMLYKHLNHHLTQFGV